MRVFMTGASGWIGSAVVPELLAAGHEVVGLARSDAVGGRRLRRSVPRCGAAISKMRMCCALAAEGADGVIHLAFIHDFSNYGHSLEVDQRAIEAFGAALSGSDRPLLIAGGLLGLGGDHVATEREMHDPAMPRAASAAATLALADKGVRSMVVRFAPTVHGEGDEGFIAMLVDIARQRRGLRLRG